MNLKAIIKKNSILTFICTYILFLWLLPNQNQSGDSYGYAFSMESGNYLTSPHHLLYNWLGYGIAQIFPGKAMLFMLKINGLLMGLSLLILNYILTKSTDKRFAFALTIFCASCMCQCAARGARSFDLMLAPWCRGEKPSPYKFGTDVHT